MKKIILTLIIVSIFSQLMAKEYIIMIAACKLKKSTEVITKKLAKDNIKTIIAKDKTKDLYYVVVNNIKTKNGANKLLKSIQKNYKNAYIIKNRKKQLAKNKNLKDSIKLKQKNEKNSKLSIVSTETNLTISKPKQDLKINYTETEKKIDKPTSGILLKDAVALALKRSQKILAKREKIIQAKRKIDEKIAAYFPTVTLSANGGRTYFHPLGGPDVKFLQSDETLTINQNIYAGGKHSNEIKREKANLYSAVAKFKDQVEEESLKVIDAYLTLIYRKKSIEATRENMLTLQKILDIVKIKEESGAATKGDLNYIKSQVENASAALVKEESKYQNAIAFYEYYVGELNSSNMPMEYEFYFTLDEKEQTLALMKKNNAKLQVALAKLRAQEFNLQSQKSKFKPTLDFTIVAKDKQSGYEGEPHEDKAKALLALNYNLYNGGKDKAILLGTKSKIQELQYKFYDIQESSLYNTKQIYENILSSKDSLKHTEKEVEANRKVTDSYWTAFKYGTQDIQALLLAQRALNRSELDAIKERQKYINSHFKLMQQTGTLLQKLELSDFINPDKIIQDKSINYFH
jgi:adhesin transport system outer membrane protein